jgi:sn1-specific diacylglycerol lipase
MPHLIYAGRHWRISSDELSLPCLCAVAGRLFWSILLLIIIIYVYDSLGNCNNGWLILSFLISSFIGCLLSILCEFLILNISLKGSIVQSEKRVGINQYLSVHMYLGIMQFILALFGLLVTQNIDGLEVPCHEDVDKHNTFLILLTIVIISQLVDIFSQICCCFIFSARKVVDNQNEENDYTQSFYVKDNEEAIQLWEGRCRTLCKSAQVCSCNLFGGSNIGEDLEAVAKVLTNFFHHDGFLDVVPTDVVAGIILVRLQQRTIIKENKSRSMQLYNNPSINNIEDGISNDEIQINMNKFNIKNYSSSMVLSQRSYNGNRDFDVNSPEDKKTMAILSRSSVYALAMYTHLIVMYMKPCTGCCRLWHSRICNIGCCSLCGTKNVFTKGDVANCMPHLSAVRVLTSEVKNSEVIHAAFYNDSTAKPYAVFIDNDIESVVIAIRGTLSLEDCMTDVLAEFIEMTAAGEQWGFNGKGKFTHDGFLKCALNIRSDLDKYKVLEQIFGNSSNSGNLFSESSEWNYAKNYSLIVTGHSLGAGTASVLTYLLRKSYPKVKCYSFGTPSATFDRQTSLGMYVY